MTRFLLPLLLIASIVRAEGPDQVFPLPPFKDGLYTRYSANAIPDGALAEALNVTIDEDVDGTVVARRGYSKYNSSAILDSKTVSGLWTFDATDGTKYFIAFSSSSFFKSTGDGSWTQITGLNGFSTTKQFDCTQTIGKFWCGNGDAVFSWDGTSTDTISGAPLGNLISRFRNRVLIAGISGSKGRLRGSGELDGRDYTLQIPGVSTTPFSLAFGGADDGEDITCLMGAYQDAFIVGKRNSLWALYGFGRTDFQIRELSREVGCIDRRSVREKNNCLYWLSLRGIEKFCGASVVRISDPIRNQLDTIVATAGNSRSATDTSQSDFTAGNLTASGPGAPMSATITPGSVVPGTWTVSAAVSDNSWVMTNVDTSAVSRVFFDDFTDGDFTSNPTWTQERGTAEISGNGIRAATLDSRGRAIITVAQTISTGTWSLTVAPSTNTAFQWRYIILSTGTVGWDTTGSGNPVNSDSVWLQANKAGSGFACELSLQKGSGTTLASVSMASSRCEYPNTFTLRITRSTNAYTTVSYNGEVVLTTYTYLSSAHSASQIASLMMTNYDTIGYGNPIFDNFYFPGFYENQISTAYNTGISTPTWGPYAVAMSSSAESSVTLKAQTSVTGTSSWSTLVTISNGEKVTSEQRRFIRHQLLMAPPTSGSPSSITDSTLSAATTGYFIGQCRAPGTAITAWGLLSCNLIQASGGSIALQISTGTTCDIVTNSTTNWTTTANNTTISVATSARVAYRALFDFDAATETIGGLLAIQDCTINWQEGQTRPPVASSVYQDRYYLAYTSSTASGSGNDHLLVLDKNDKWTLFDNHSCYSLSTYERKLYCGSSTNVGRVWLLDSGTDDDGTAIRSRIRTKAFNLGLPERRKSFTRLYLDLEPSPDPSQTISLTGRYTLERSTPVYSLGNIDLNEDPGSIITAKAPFPMINPISGRYIQVELESNALNSPWRLFSGRLYFQPLDPE